MKNEYILRKNHMEIKTASEKKVRFLKLFGWEVAQEIDYTKLTKCKEIV